MYTETNLYDWLNRTVPTGGTTSTLNTEFLFRHLIVSEQEFEYLLSLDDCGELFMDLDILCFNTYGVYLLISIQKEGNIEFKHVTGKENAYYIKRDGFHIDTSWTPDLGIGVYCIDDRDLLAHESLENYILEQDFENLVAIYGAYEGKYLYCGYGDGHYGYILLQEPKNICNITIESL